MIVALPVCAKDEHLALLGLRVARKFEISVPFDCVVVHERGHDVKAVVEAATGYFRKVETLMYEPCPYGTAFPRPHNWAWQHTARFMATQSEPWLWWEPDAVPCRNGWLSAIEEAYVAEESPLAGFIVRGRGKPYLAGVAVYPAHISLIAVNAMLTRQGPFDMVISYLDGGMRQSADISYVIHHDFREDGGEREWGEDENGPACALWHRCKNGSLHRLLLNDAPRSSKVTMAAVSNITVVITNFQRPEHLWPCFKSCLQAQVSNLVVSCSGTTAEVRKVLKKIKQKKSDTVITAINEDRGCNETWLRGVLEVKTPKVHILHDDDWLLPEFEKVVIGAFDQYDVVHWDGAKHLNGNPIEGTYNTRDDLKDGEYPLTYLLPFLLKPGGFTISPVGGVFPRDHVVSVLQECQDKFDHRFMLRPTMMVGNDLLLWLRACQRYSTFYYTHKPHISYGHWAGSVSFDDVSHKRFGLLPIYKATRDYFLKQFPRILHVVQRYPFSNPECRRRYTQAAETWEQVYANGLVYSRPQWVWPRDSTEWGDERQTPFVRDVLKQAAAEAGPMDIIALTNDDTLANVFLWYHALHMLKTKGAVTSFRRNVAKASDVDYLHYPEKPPGERHCGRDAFFFTQDWIKEHVNELPDYVMAYCDFDSTLDMLVRLTAGNKPKASEFLVEHPSSNLPTRFVYHEDHDAFWSTGTARHEHPCNIRNHKLTEDWFAKRLGWSMPDLTPKP